MEARKVAIIGGTGVGERLIEGRGEPVSCDTQFGRMTGLERGGVLMVARHGPEHKVPPHKVDYRANAVGLRELGIEFCLSSAAVGSVNRDFHPGLLVVCSDFIDLNPNKKTLFDDEVRHTDFSAPFDPAARAALLQDGVRDGGVYVGVLGPRYETPAEVQYLRTIGGDVVGMTAASEAISMREAGVRYACLAVVTIFAAGLSEQPLSHAEVKSAMRESLPKVAAILREAARCLRESG
jgi:5'-methylthioadenosine phosphorylase